MRERGGLRIFLLTRLVSENVGVAYWLAKNIFLWRIYFLLCQLSNKNVIILLIITFVRALKYGKQLLLFLCAFLFDIMMLLSLKRKSKRLQILNPHYFVSKNVVLCVFETYGGSHVMFTWISPINQKGNAQRTNVKFEKQFLWGVLNMGSWDHYSCRNAE